MNTWLKNRKLPVIPVYPILLGLYPVLYLWSANRAQEPAYVVIPSLLITLAAILAVYLLAFAILRNIHRAALLAAVLAFYLLTYGHLANYLTSIKKDYLQGYMLGITAVLVLALLAYLAYLKAGSPMLTKTLNLISAALVLFNFVSATPYYLSMARLQKVSAHPGANQAQIPVTGSSPNRDVYFILLDNYGRQDILQQSDNFDNSALVNALKQRGFIFPDCAQGNYFWTAPVITSILNMNYLDTLGVPQSAYTQRGGYDKMAPLIQDSEVIKKFRAYGYHVVTFRGFMGLIDIKNTDTYISYDQDKSYTQRLETHKFQDLYYDTTLFAPLDQQTHVSDWLSKNVSFLKKDAPTPSPLAPEFQQVYDQNLYAFNALTNIPKEIQSPKFVYAHIYTAHWPFMMSPNGSLRLPFSQELTKEGYIDGVKYTNSRILGAIDSILKNSKTPPVIILQGDHSDEMVDPVEWSGVDRVKILSAYYLPDGGDQMLYKNISPVNNFRLIFQHYFGENLPLLPDINHYLNTQTKQEATAPMTCISDTIK